MEVCTAHTILYGDLPPLIPEPVEHINLTPTVSITPAPTNLNLKQKLQRPTQLDLDGPVRPNRHLKPPTLNIETPIRRSVSPGTTPYSKLFFINYYICVWLLSLLYFLMCGDHVFFKLTIFLMCVFSYIY